MDNSTNKIYVVGNGSLSKFNLNIVSRLEYSTFLDVNDEPKLDLNSSNSSSEGMSYELFTNGQNIIIHQVVKYPADTTINRWQPYNKHYIFVYLDDVTANKFILIDFFRYE